MKRAAPYPGMIIRESTRFTPGVYTFDGSDAIAIAADDVEIDGRGAVLKSMAAAPELPQGDHLYSPGNLGLSCEEHELLMRQIEIQAESPLCFEYLFWGKRGDNASVAASRDGRDWRGVKPSARGQDGPEGLDGWEQRSYHIGTWPKGDFWLKLSIPPETISPESPCFYDAFRLLSHGNVIWRGDARENWDKWHNTGFSILKRIDRKYYSGVAVRSEGCRGVRLKNLKAEGFLTGLFLKNCAGWTITGNDFSDNYNDPDYGWGDGTESFGGIYMEEVHDSLLKSNRGTKVWNGFVLRRCSGNRIENNTFSHCSNTCLKLSQSSHNTIRSNDFSWGLRIYPGEVHARDSVCLLVESGSDENRFIRNDFGHGGDGIFIRVLNSWCSTGNVFLKNDCSHANNNAVEAWSPGNTYIRNRASWSSYGFWLGGSDDTVLIGNEVMHNGKAFQNAPEPFGNAGISVVHGSSSGMRLLKNRIIDNSGPGLSFAYREDSPARSWLISGNRIRKNRNDPRGYSGHGVFMEFCRDVSVTGNDIRKNEGCRLVLGRSCRNVTFDSRRCRVVENLHIRLDDPPVAGKSVLLSLAGPRGCKTEDIFSEFLWDFGDGEEQTAGHPSASHEFRKPGRRRVSVIARGKSAAGIASRSICVLPEGELLADCTDPGSWHLLSPWESSLELDSARSVLGSGSLEAAIRRGCISSLVREFPGGRDLRGFAGLSFFYRYGCDLNTHRGKRNRTVGIRLISDGEDSFEYAPEWQPKSTPSEDRYDWVYLSAPWSVFRKTGTPDLAGIRKLEILFGPDEPSDFVFWIDGIMVWKQDGSR